MNLQMSGVSFKGGRHKKIMNDIEITHEVQLTDLERARFVELEETVHVAIRSFIVLGDALREIREKRLYREYYPTFEDYCHDKFRFTRHRAFQLIESARVGNHLVTIVNTEPPSNEGQIRPLVKVSEEIAAEAWKRVSLAKQRPITGKLVSEALRQVLGTAPQEKTQSNDVFDKLLQASIAVDSEVLGRGSLRFSSSEISAITQIHEIITQLVTCAQLAPLFPPRRERPPSGGEAKKTTP